MQELKKNTQSPEVYFEEVKSDCTLKQLSRMWWKAVTKSGRELYIRYKGRFLGAITERREGKIIFSVTSALRIALQFSLFLMAALASFPGNASPVGLAFCAAMGKKAKCDGVPAGRKKAFSTPPALAGSLVSMLLLGKTSFIYIAVALCILSIRGVLTKRKFDEPQLVRIAFAGAAGFCVAISSAVLEGFSPQAWGGVMLLCLLTPLFAYIFSSIYTDGLLCPSGTHHFLNREVGLGGVIFAAVYTLGSFTIGGFCPGFALGVFLTLHAARSRGPIFGGLVGMFLGLAGGTVYGIGACCGILGCAGFFAGLFFANSLGAIAAFFLVGMGCAVLSLENTTLWSALTDILLGIAVFYPLMPHLPKDSKELEEINKHVLRQNVIKLEQAKRKINHLSEAFSSLSVSFSDISTRLKKPREEEIFAMINGCCQEHCEVCPVSKMCWGKEYVSSEEPVMILTKQLKEQGKIKEDDLSGQFRMKCSRFSSLVEQLNVRYRDMRKRRIHDDGTDILAAEYSALAGLLNETADGLEENAANNADYITYAREALEQLDLDPVTFAVYGKRSPVVDVFGVSPERIPCSPEEISAVFSTSFGCQFASPSFIYRDGNAMMRMKKKRNFSLECAKASRAKRGECLNGDSVNFFENDDDCFYTVLCDGMGSGHDAALTSRLSGLVVERLMTCVSTKSATLEMLNTVLLSKPDESYTTVDMLEVDLMEGIATFIKAGAAPTFVIRDENLFKIFSATPPAGTMRTMRAEQTTLELQDGDVIVMLSDGLTEGGEAPDKLLRTLAFDMLPRPADMANKIIESSLNPATGAKDDMTAVIIRVKMDK